MAKSIMFNGLEYTIEPGSNRRVIEKDRILQQRGWFEVKAPFGNIRPAGRNDYYHFSEWFEKNCEGYWQYPQSEIFWFSDSGDVIRYYLGYY